MSKSYKLKDGNYLDSSSIVHNKKQLSEILNDLGDYTTAEGQYTTATWATGTATRLVSDMLLYQAGPDSTSESSWDKIAGGTFSTLVYAQAGQTIIPYVHTPVAGLKWNVKIVGMFIK